MIVQSIAPFCAIRCNVTVFFLAKIFLLEEILM